MTTTTTTLDPLRDLEEALTAMSEAGNALACSWPESDKDAILRNIDSVFLRLYARFSEQRSAPLPAQGDATDRLSEERLSMLERRYFPISHEEVLALIAELRSLRSSPSQPQPDGEVRRTCGNCGTIKEDGSEFGSGCPVASVKVPGGFSCSWWTQDPTMPTAAPTKGKETPAYDPTNPPRCPNCSALGEVRQVGRRWYATCRSPVCSKTWPVPPSSPSDPGSDR